MNFTRMFKPLKNPSVVIILIACSTFCVRLQNGADVIMADQGFNAAYYAQTAKGTCTTARSILY